MYEAARIHDGISHSSALAGFLIGAAIGVALIAAVAFATFTCGFGVGLLAGLVAGVGASGILMLGEAIGSAIRTPSGKIITGSPNVYTNGRAAALVQLSGVACDKHPPLPRVAEGSGTVFINGLAAARIDDRTECDARIQTGSSDVFIGGGRTGYLKIHPEIPEALRTAVDWAFTLAGLAGGLAGLAGKAAGKGMRALAPCAARYIAGFAAGEAVGRYVAAPALSGLIGHPVEITTGRKLLLPHDEIDFNLPGRLPLTGARFYGSDLQAEGMFGRGWRHEWEISLRIESERLIHCGVQGREIPFPLLEPGQKVYSRAEQLTLGRLKDGRYLAHGLDGIFHLFDAPDANGIAHLQRIEDPMGNYLQFERGEHGRLLQVAGRGQRVALHYAHPVQRLTAIELIEGGMPCMLVRYAYDDNGQLASVTDRMDRVTRRFAYQDGLMCEQHNALGMQCSYRWEEIGGSMRVVEHRTSEGEHYRFRYDPQNRTSGVEDVLGRTAQWRYDQHFQITEAVWFDGGRYRFDYDEDGNLTGMHLPGRRSVQLAYDELGRLISETDPLGRVTATGYHAESLLPTQQTFPDGSQWTARYDERGQLLSTADPLGRETQFDYRADGLPESVTDPRGGIKRMQWSERGQITAYTDCSGKTTRYDYDGNGYLRGITDAAGNRTIVERQPTGEPILILRPDGAQEQFEYDAAGLPARHRDAAGHSEHWEYNRRGQVIRSVSKTERTVSYQYDAHGRLVKLTNANGASYQFDYDHGDRLVSETGVDGIVKQYRYDDAGNAVVMELTGRDDNGKLQHRVTRMEYDAAGRLSARHTDTAVTSYAYDALDRLLSASRTPTDAGKALGIESDTVRFEYDAAGQLIAEHGANGSLRHNYDELGNPLSLTLPQGQRLDMLSYGSGHVHQLRMGDRVICDIERDDLHREILRTQGRLSTGFGYDAMNRRSWQSSMRPEQAEAGTNTVPFSPNKGQLWRSYGYNAADELFERHDALRGHTQYRYDMDGRLLGCLTKTGTEHFSWDDADNPCDTSTGRSAGAVRNNRLMVWQDLRYSYDAFGNVLSRRKGSWQQQHFTYDADDRLIEARGDTRQGELITRFAYDALGRRIGKTVRSAQDWAPGQQRSDTKFVWQGLRLLQEITPDRASTYLYEQDGGPSYAPLARLDQSVRSDGSIGHGQLYYFHTDQIGTPLEVTDEDGRLVWAGEYDAWGRMKRQVLDAPLKMGEEFVQPLRFAGQYEDDSTGLHYNTFRYYDPEVGRFLTRDPIGLDGGINLYRYAVNPLSWNDPLGLNPSYIDPNTINYSQSWVSPNDYVEVMFKKGWIGDPLNVINRDGVLVSFDNRRLAAAQSLGLKEVPVNMVAGSSAYPKSTTGKTWDVAFNERLKKNGLGQYGTPEKPAIGAEDGTKRITQNRSNRVGC
ncbi:RHS repeat-associated core domain-containing protein [Noviherbaspirillum aerium]|uniref:RHS repeat-associated core domain-containing protein n=1 Tax=Noviherbaspirillum aerium TaxID=2588497 RepID=UPI00124C255F|nr:RHS repeat-associated core domain-containing protein [Noviherbaspirillum aerium]